MTKLFLSAAAALLVGTATLAQSVPAGDLPPGIDPARVTGPLKSGSFDAPLVDEGNAAAKALAAQEGISVGEATRRLRLSRQAANVAHRLRGRETETINATYFDGADLVIVVPKAGQSRKSEIRNSFPAELRDSVKFRDVERSTKELKSVIARLAPVLKNLEGFQGIQIRGVQNDIVVLSTDVAATLAGIQAADLDLPDFVSVALSDPIRLTEAVYGGTAANFSAGDCPGGTWGFIAVRTSDGTPGVLTAGHTTDLARVSSLRYDYLDFANCTGGSSSQSVISRLLGSNDDPNTHVPGIDLAWHRNSGSTYHPLFWDGVGWRYVTAVLSPYGGEAVCKFGRTTKQTCGTVTPNMVWSNGYGYMSDVVANSNVPSPMNANGDSGGPIWFSTGTAVGIVHASWGDRHMLFTDVAALYERGTGLQIGISN